MNLIKTSFYTSISTAINFISGFIVIKVVAVKIGPAGIALVGQFQNSTAILTMLATAATTMGVVKHLAQYKDDPDKAQKIISTAFFISLVSSIIISLSVIAFSKNFSRFAFKTNDYQLVYLLFGLFLTTVAFNTIFSATLNGLKKIKQLTIINICASLIGVVCTITGAYLFGIIGVLISSTASAIIVFIINLFIFSKLGVKWQPNLKNWDTGFAKSLSAFSLMALVSSLVVPAMQILVRNKIISKFSTQEAGYWQSVTKISDYYLGFITTVLAVYYLPRLAEINDKKILRAEIAKGYSLILPAVGIIAFFIWALKDFVISILFTQDFLPMKPLFTFQLLGDFFKIGSWLLAYIMVAKAMTKTFIITEITFSLSFVLLSYYFIDNFGIIGATYAFCVNYGCYWLVVLFITKKHLR